MQVDAQVMYRLHRFRDFQVVASFLNLNNEIFGFYQGSEKYPIQREYYKTTYSFGLRWTPSFNKRRPACSHRKWTTYALRLWAILRRCGDL